MSKREFDKLLNQLSSAALDYWTKGDTTGVIKTDEQAMLLANIIFGQLDKFISD